jgi:hypothetical protein
MFVQHEADQVLTRNTTLYTLRHLSVPVQPQIPIKVNIAQPRQKLHVIGSREHSLNVLAGIRGCRRNHQTLLR